MTRLIIFDGVVALPRKRSFRIEKLAIEYFKRANEIVSPFDQRIRYSFLRITQNPESDHSPLRSARESVLETSPEHDNGESLLSSLEEGIEMPFPLPVETRHRAIGNWHFASAHRKSPLGETPYAISLPYVNPIETDSVFECSRHILV
jgi:hypothetical protein